MDFEYVIDIPSDITTLNQIVESTNSLLVCYKNPDIDKAKAAQIVLGKYSDLNWGDINSFTDRSDIVSFGTKMLPGAGGFYYANFEDGSHIIDHIDEIT